MLKKLMQISYLIIGGTLGVIWVPHAFAFINLDNVFFNNIYVAAIIGAVVFYAIMFWSIDYVTSFIKWIEEKLIKTPISDILFGTLGLLLGLVIAYLISIPIGAIGVPVLDTVLPVVLTFVFGYLGFQVSLMKKAEFLGLFSGVKSSRKRQGDDNVGKKKILDTSVIIDGRIADICQTGFLDGTIVIPQFVLSELQYIADSSDTLKRARGRRGLDILNRLQKEVPVHVEISDVDFEETQEVDAKLVKLTKKISGVLVTNDYNLNKISELQNIPVLNINDLANAVKPVVIPGEEMYVLVIKDGKEHNQGVAYLDDGTMIVVDDGRNYMGKNIDVVVTSVLQTSAGRMIFAKPKSA